MDIELRNDRIPHNPFDRQFLDMIHPPVQRSTIGKILERKDEFLEMDENHPSLKRAMLRNPKWPVHG